MAFNPSCGCSVAQSCPTLCDPMDCSTPGLPVHHQLPELAQTRVHWVGGDIQPSHPLLSLSPPTFNVSQHQGLSWVLIISCAFSGARITSFMIGPPDRHTWMLQLGWTLHLQNTPNSLWFRLQSYLFPNLSPSSYSWPVTLARLSGLTLRQNEVPVRRSTYLILLELTRL